MFLARLGSFNALEQTQKSSTWKRKLGAVPPSADTLGRVCAGIDPDALRSIVGDLYRTLKGRKALQRPVAANLSALVIDGHESMASYRRCCPQCLKRTCTTANGKQTQYHHRHVAASLVTHDIHLFLDIEPIQAGECEVTAARRLVERVHQAMPRGYDVVLADALYARADFIQTIEALGKQVLLVLKQEERALLVDARSLFEHTAGKPLRRRGEPVMAWDIAGLTSWESLKRPVRVVRSLETHRVRRQINGKVDEQTSEWIWVTTLSPSRASTEAVIELGHARWAIENQGFNEAVNAWHMDHVYRHEPTAMIVLMLLGMIAYNLFHAFYRFQLKPALRNRCSLQHVSRLIQAEIYIACIRARSRAPS